MNNLNCLCNDTRDYKFNTVKDPVSHKYEVKNKTIIWAPRLRRVKNVLELRGHAFIKFEDLIYYFDGLPPMNRGQLRLYYDRLIYREKKSQITNWSQKTWHHTQYIVY